MKKISALSLIIGAALGLMAWQYYSHLNLEKKPSAGIAQQAPTSTTSEKNNPTPPALEIGSIEILSQNYWVAEAEITYQSAIQGTLGFLAESLVNEHDNAGHSCTTIGTRYQPDGNEQVKTKVWIHRPFNLNEPVESNYIQFGLWDACGTIYPGPRLIHSIKTPLRMEWPGADSLPSKTADLFNSTNILPKLYVETSTPQFTRVIDELLAGGYPFHKIEVRPDGIRPGASSHSSIRFNAQFEANTLLNVFNIVANLSEKTKIERANYNDGNSHITIRGISSNSKGFLNSEVTASLTPSSQDVEVYSTLGLLWRSPSELSMEKTAKAKKLLDNGDHNSIRYAKKILDEASVLFSNLPELYIEYARYYMKSSDDFSENEKSSTGNHVLKILQESAQRFPDHSNTFVLLGYVEATQELYKASEASLAKANELGTDNLWLWVNWGLLHKNQGNFDSAIEKYARAADVDQVSENNETAYGTALWELTGLLRTQGKTDKAEIYFNRHHTTIPTVYSCMYREHARMLLESESRYDDAVKWASTSLKQGCPASAELSEAHYRQWFDATDDMNKVSYISKARLATLDQARVFYNISNRKKGRTILEALIRENEDIHSVSQGTTALIHAVNYGNSNAAKLLIQLGADIDFTPPPPDLSALALAVVSQNSDMVDLLMEHNADPYQKTPYGPTITEVAMQIGQQEVIEALARKGKKIGL